MKNEAGLRATVLWTTIRDAMVKDYPFWNIPNNAHTHMRGAIVEVVEHIMELESNQAPPREAMPAEIGAHAEAVDWITSNMTAIRRDNGDMDYSLRQVARAYDAGKANAKEGDVLDTLHELADAVAAVEQGRSIHNSRVDKHDRIEGPLWDILKGKLGKAIDVLAQGSI